MLELMTGAVFLLVAAATMWAGLRARNSRLDAIARLAPEAGLRRNATPSALIWRDLVNRIGARFPASTKDLSRLKTRLIRAGFRSPAAPSYSRERGPS